MKIPIPSDWDGETWECFQVQWPASREYTGVFLGLLSLLTRGRLWDEQTGQITDAQAVGWQIYDRNFPLVSCDGTIIQDGTSGAQNATCGAFWDESEDFDMPCLDLTGLIKIENGELWVKNSCCEWESLGVLETQEAPIPTAVLDSQLPVGQEASACGRAYAVWDTIIQTAHAVWDHHLDAPWFTIGNIKSASPTNLTTSGIWIAVSQAVLTDSLWGGDDIFNPTKLQQVLCEMLPRIDATTDPLTDAEWDAIYNAFRSFGNAGDLFIQNLYTQIAAFAITRARLSNVAQAGALNNAQNCDCPGDEGLGEPFFGVGMGFNWRYVYDFRSGVNGFTLDNPETHQNGTGLWADNIVTDHIANIIAHRAIDNVNNGSTLQMVGLIWENMGDETWNSEVKVGVNNFNGITMADVVAMGGTAPATAGVFTFVKSVNWALGAGDDELRLQLQAEHLTDVSQKLVSVLFAGAGPGPMTP